MIHIHYTFAYAAVLGLLYAGLSIRVIIHRVKTKVLLGDGANQGLSVAVRTHANFSEYVPLALFLIAGVESMNHPLFIVHALGGVLVFARVAHVHGLATNKTAGHGRPIGTILTLLTIIVSSVMVLISLLS